MAERGHRDGGRPWLPAVRNAGRAARGALRYRQAPIGERVRQVHLEHFCPGGAGLPVTGSGPIGLGPAGAAAAGWEDNAAQAAGQHCGRCGRPIAPGQDARRRACGTWVHEACPR